MITILMGLLLLIIKNTKCQLNSDFRFKKKSVHKHLIGLFNSEPIVNNTKMIERERKRYTCTYIIDKCSIWDKLILKYFCCCLMLLKGASEDRRKRKNKHFETRKLRPKEGLTRFNDTLVALKSRDVFKLISMVEFLIAAR